MPAAARRRLQHTCFRNGDSGSGKFRFWTNFWAVLQHYDVRVRLIEEISDILENEENPYGTWDFTIKHPDMWIGWASTMSLEKLPRGTRIKPFKPNKRTNAFAVSSKKFKAPRTRAITFVVNIKEDDPLDVVIVYSIYPGQAVELNRRIPAEEAVFIPLEHKGV